MKNLLNKSLEKPALALIVRKMLQHFEDFGFYHGQLGFNGNLLKEHVDREWMLNNFYHADEPTFLASDFVDGFQRVQKHCESLPISFVYREESQENFEKSSGDFNDEVKKLFNNVSSVVLKKTTLCHPDEGMNFFYKQQRDRKIWWRKVTQF